MFKDKYEKLNNYIQPSNDLVNKVKNFSNDNTIKRRDKLKSIILKPAIALMTLIMTFFSIPVLAANVPIIYEIMYLVSPSVAQYFMPIQKSCEDQGIKMEVVSTSIKGNEALIYVTMQDLTDDRISKNIDLFDSYSINTGFDSVGSCNVLDYNEETKTATFMITITNMENKEIDSEKITFTIKEFISNKYFYEGELQQLDLKLVESAKETQKINSFRGGSGKDDIWEKRYDYNFLIPDESKVFSVVEGVNITAIGFIDNKLHIQVYYEDIIETDNHGSINLIDKNGNKVEKIDFAFWDNERKGSYEEIIFDITQEEIQDYQVYGRFITSKGTIKGNWQVTFELEEK